MGLSGRKAKQRIGHDPRNLSWADDAARFGSNYLSKFGWDSSKGLGVSGEGRTTHVKVAQKLDMMGIGAAHQKDPNGVAWKQNRDYENLLKRLNGANGVEEEEQAGKVVDGFVKPKGNLDEEDKDEEKNMEQGPKEKKEKRKKDKGNADKDKDKDKEKRKKRKRDENVEDTDRKLKKKKRDDGDKHACNPNVKSAELVESRPTSPEPSHSAERKASRAIPRHRSHRARHIAAKSIGSKSAAAISEILGIAPSPSFTSSATPSGTQTPQEGKLTSIYDDNDDTPDTDKITTSTKSLQDYFKEKIGKAKGSTSSVAATSLFSGTGGVDYDDNPRAGLGSRPELAIDAPRIGLSQFSALVSSSFMKATSVTSMLNTAPKDDGEGGDGKKKRKHQKRSRRSSERQKTWVDEAP